MDEEEQTSRRCQCRRDSNTKLGKDVTAAQQSKQQLIMQRLIGPKNGGCHRPFNDVVVMLQGVVAEMKSQKNGRVERSGKSKKMKQKVS